MRLLIETTRGWKLTLTTPSHVVENTARPGAKSFIARDSKSTPAADHANSKFFRRSLGPYDIIEESCEESNSTPAPSRCRSFRKTFRWFRIHFSRTSHAESSHPSRNDEVEDPPSYHHHHCFELDSSAVQELPGETPEMFGQVMSHELEVRHPRAFNIEGYDVDNAGPSYPPYGLNEIDKWDHGNMVNQYRRGPTPRLIQSDPINMTPQSYEAPAMSRDGSSGKSSSDSPYTPGRDSNQDMQDRYDFGFANNMVSPLDATQPGTGVYAADGHHSFSMQRYNTFSDVSPLVGQGQYEIPSPIPGLYPHEIEDFPFAPESYQEYAGQVHPSQGPSTNPRQLHHGLSDPRLGTWEYNGSVWCLQPAHRNGLEGTNTHMPDQQSLDGIQQSPSHIDNGRHHPLLQESSATAAQTEAYLPVACRLCKKWFRGRYCKGNMKRHLNTVHNAVRSMAGMTCRECNQVFRRSDAKRKHEWNKHGLLDAKPTNRRLN